MFRVQLLCTTSKSARRSLRFESAGSDVSLQELEMSCLKVQMKEMNSGERELLYVRAISVFSALKS